MSSGSKVTSAGLVGLIFFVAQSAVAFVNSESDRLRAWNNTALYFEGPPSGEAKLFRARGSRYEFLVAPKELGVWLSKSAPRAPLPGKRRIDSEAVAGLRSMRITFPGCNAEPRMLGEHAGQAFVHHLQGPNPESWRRNLSTFGMIRVRELYDGIDVVYYGNQRHLEYDFIVAPGADPGLIRIAFHGIDSLRLTEEGAAVMALGGEVLEQPKPVFYQVIDGERRQVNGGFRIIDDRTIAFDVGPYDDQLALVLDPILSYSTYFGGNEGDLALAVKLDPEGNVYVAGQTLSARLPLTLPPGGFQTDFAGGNINGDAFIAKFAPDGTLRFFTYLGGRGNDGALDLAVDSLGQVRLAGFTDSPDFPVSNAVYPIISGGQVPTGVHYTDAFVAQLNADGSDLVFSTYLGGSGIDSADAVALDPQGNTYVGGYTYSTNFPVTPGALNNVPRSLNHFQGGLYDGFVAKISSGGNSVVYSTYLGGTNVDEVQGIAADELGYAYVTGYTASTNFPTLNAFRDQLNGWPRLPLQNDAFVAKITPSGDAIAYSTFLGGTNSDAGFRIVTEPSGVAYVTGSTLSRDFPNTATNIPGLKVGFTGSTPSSGDVFLTKINADGSLGESSRFGGPNEDVGWDLSLDASGNIFIVGTTSSNERFPLFASDDWLPPNKRRSKDETVFVTAFKSDWSALLYSLVMGGEREDYGYGIAADPAGNTYIVGRTLSPNFPVKDPLQAATNDRNDAFLSKINLEPVLQGASSPEGLVVRWRAFSPEYQVETSKDLDSGAGWSAFSQEPELKDGWHELKVPATPGSRLFRLRRSQ